ncbi:MAG: DNA polymerase IV [Bermanella sp.]
MARQVLHVDCDCFYAAVEMRDQPEYRGVPIAIGGARERRGVIATCNYPARRYGVRSAMASAQALTLCPHLIMLPGNMAKYAEVSSQLMIILKQYALAFEPVSVDEAFLELAATSNAALIAQQIRQQIFSELGITVSVGIAPNKFLAKVASDWRKPNGQFAIAPSEVHDFVGRLPVKLIAGVGPKIAEKLKGLGIHTCQDVRDVSAQGLRSQMGKFGDILIERAQGIDDRLVRVRDRRKSISMEHTFVNDLTAEHEINQMLDDMWPKFLARVERAGLHLRQLAPFVKVKFADFQVTTLADHQRGVTMADYRALLAQAMRRADKAVRLIGIGGRLQALNNRQLGLF